MKTVRLPKKLEQQLKTYATREGVSESQIIRDALVEYMAHKTEHITPYEAGKNLFGQVGSEGTTSSSAYKSELKKKIRERKASH